MKIFVIDFSKDKSLIQLCSEDNIVQFEQMDGALAYRKSKAFMPDMIVVNHATKPSHGRITALKINQRKMTSEIPIYFVDGSDVESEKIKAFGNAISKNEFNKMLNDILIR